MTSKEEQPNIVIDNTRASRDGHQYHEIWAARVALELLPPSSTVSVLSIEGFSIEDEPLVSNAAMEIADLVRYRDGRNIYSASSVEVLQFKYSVAREAKEMRASDIKKTLKKFAATEADFIGRVGADRVETVVSYEIVTNRPFSSTLIAAITGLSSGTHLDGDVADQANQIKDALPDIGNRLTSFLKRIILSGTQGTLSENRTVLRRTLASWSTPSDPQTKVRLNSLCNLVRDKAGSQGQNNNEIDRVAVLACLEIDDERDLFPTPAAFSRLSKIISRPMIKDVLNEMSQGGPPLLIDATGGMGKTVLMQDLAERLSTTNAVVLFDCFGGGAWRDPADARHLPEKAFPHIVNLLAAQGLCDILIPGTHGHDLLRGVRRRLEHAIKSLRLSDQKACIVLLLDAIDHAAEQARATKSDSFAHLLLQTLALTPIEGVIVIASCRTERRDLARGEATCRRFEIPQLSQSEITAIAKANQSDLITTEISDLSARCDGNPRMLVALLRAGRPYHAHTISVSHPDDTLLERLIWERFQKAIEEARRRGSTSEELHNMLAALGILPPPVPLAELAAAQDLTEAAVKSFASDLWPLLAYDPRGLIFADEPTETLVQRRFRDDVAARETVVKRLMARQEESNYAARALPFVLTSLHRTDELIALAFQDRFPRTAISRVAQRAIRLSRLASALIACAQANRVDDLTRLLVEASRVAGGNERSDHFLQEHPDLVAISGDPEALRRLLETRTGWVGKRHASLSIVYALSDNIDEARRNARRAFDWLNWRVKQHEKPGDQHLPQVGDLERYGPAYWALLAGQPSRVVCWIDQWRDHYSFHLFEEIVSLLECHSMISARARSIKEGLIRKVCRCRRKSRSMFAALLHHSSLEQSQAIRLIKLLAHASSSASPTRHHQAWSLEKYAFTLPDALLSAAIKAVRLGLYHEARLIVDALGLKRPSLDQLDSEYWVSEGIQSFLLAGCIRAAIEEREPTLIDFCPDDIDKQIQRRNARQSAASFEKAVEALLKPRKEARKKQNKAKGKFNNKDREKALRTLTHRVRPLLPHAAAVTNIIRNSASEAEIKKAIELLIADVAVKESYPYRRRPRFIASICFPLLFNTLDALEVLTDSTATLLAGWLLHSPIAQNQQTIHVAARLARRPQTRGAASSLAHKIADEIATETSTSLQVNLYGALARAIWLASQAEAKAYFKRGLEFADALGSDDYDKISELTIFATQYHGPPLPPSVSHSFARMNELNLSEEEEKYGWVPYGQAMSRIGGIGALATVARLADRRKVDLSYSLPPLLTALVNDGRLAPDIASALIGIDEPVETWSWMLADFVDAVLPRLPQNRCEEFAAFVLCELDRNYRGSPPADTIKRIAATTNQYLSESSISRKRIVALQPMPVASSTSDESADPAKSLDNLDTPLTPELLAGVNVSDPLAIDALLEKKELQEDGRRWPARILRALGQKIVGIDERCGFLKAVCELQIPSLIDKLTGINELASQWKEQSLAVRDILPGLAQQLGIRHASELIDSDWDSSYGLTSLIKFADHRQEELIPVIIVALRERAQFVGSVAWLRFAVYVAQSASPNAIGSALEHFLTKSAADLPPNIADGPWNPGLAIPQTEIEVTAGLLWQRLGSPVTADRWRAAHALRRLVQIGRSDVLTPLVAHLDSTDAGPFQDQSLPFFYLHARLWLYVSLARIAVDSPEIIRPFKDKLKSAAFDPGFPHILIRHFAGAALVRVADTLPLQEGNDLRDALETLNVSPLPRAKQPRFGNSQSYEERPERLENEDHFHFDYDFDKYYVNGVSQLFALPRWRIEDACVAWIRKWSSDVQDMYSCPRIKQRSYDDGIGSWSGVSTPAHDLWGGHLAWHALMLTVGEFLPTTPIVGYSWKDDPWKEWLAGQVISGPKDLWLADGTDPFPADLRRSIPSSKHPEDWVCDDPAIFAKVIGLTPSFALQEYLIVDGFWRGVDNTNFHVQSVIVGEDEAMNVALTAALAPPALRYLPQQRNIGFDRESLVANLVCSWITDPSDAAMQFDRYDPYVSVT